MNLRRTLEQRLSSALVKAGAPEGTAALAGPSSKPQFGDYQANGAMAAAKRLKTNPRKLAEQAVAEAGLSDLAERVEVAGPGFINVTLKREFLQSQLAAAAADERLGVAKPDRPETVVVDYSGPNLAKEMHVGHLRSTIIGDALARTLDFLGHGVIRQNHVGDWGTQFGMLLALYEEKRKRFHDGESCIYAVPHLDDLEEFYREAKQRFDGDEEFRLHARETVVLLQSGDSGARGYWDIFLDQSLQHCEQVYSRLGILLVRGDVRGESAYNDELPGIVEGLKTAGLLEDSQGAQGVFLPEFTNKEGESAFVIVRKSDGGYLYATTDLAAIRYRVNELRADRVLYVTDSRQAEHFAKVFAIADKARWSVKPGPQDGRVSLEHVPFGMMLGEGRTPFKTREGGTVKLMDLLDEAESRAREFVAAKAAERGDEPSAEDLARIAHVVGIGAVKYADLSQNRASDYVFSWDKMLSLDGNTAPYMQYAYARIRSIFGKEKGSGTFSAELAGEAASDEAGSTPGSAPDRAEKVPDPFSSSPQIAEPAERALAVKLLQFPETVEAVAAECLPNLLCAYLYELAGAFMGFYENCPVLKADEPTRAGRLALCDLTARTIRTGLSLLGIEVLDRM